MPSSSDRTSVLQMYGADGRPRHAARGDASRRDDREQRRRLRLLQELAPRYLSGNDAALRIGLLRCRQCHPVVGRLARTAHDRDAYVHRSDGACHAVHRIETTHAVPRRATSDGSSHFVDAGGLPTKALRDQFFDASRRRFPRLPTSRRVLEAAYQALTNAGAVARRTERLTRRATRCIRASTPEPAHEC